MNKEEFEKYINRVAQNHNITPEEVLKDIEHCIKASAEAVRAVNDPEMQKNWQQIPKEGDIPTPYAFISHIAQTALQKLKEKDNS